MTEELAIRLSKRRRIEAGQAALEEGKNILKKMIDTGFTTDLRGEVSLSTVILQKMIESKLEPEEEKAYKIILNKMMERMITGFYNQRIPAKIASKLRAIVLLYFSESHAVVLHEPRHKCVKNIDNPGSELIDCIPGSEKFYRSDVSKYCTEAPVPGNKVAFEKSVALKEEEIIQLQHTKNSICKNCATVIISVDLKPR